MACLSGAFARLSSSQKSGWLSKKLIETVYWLELLSDNKVIAERLLADLTVEGRELTAIFTAARSTMRSGKQITN